MVLFHVGESYNMGLSACAAGVDMFFVVSGFIMWVTTVDRPVTPRSFWRRRFIRVVPIYWVATLATAASVHLRPAFFYGHDASLPNIVRSLLFVPVIRGDQLHPVVLQGWTLSYEMLFYALFALALLVPTRARLMAVVGSLTAICLLHPPAPAGYAAAVTSPLLLEFAFGVLLGAGWTSGRRLPVEFGWLLIAAGLAGFAIQSVLPGLPRVVGWGVPAGLVVSGVVVWDMAGKRSEIRALHFLGDASYSIYLWHVMAASILAGLLARLGISASAMPAAVLLGSVGVTLLIYVVLERPMNRVLHLRRRETLSGIALAPNSLPPDALPASRSERPDPMTGRRLNR